MSTFRELYPVGAPSLEQCHELLHRHARKLETGIQQDIAANERHVALAETVDKIDREMSEQTQALVDIKLDLAHKDGDTKRLGVWVALATPIVSAALMMLANYLTRPPSGPGPVRLTPEQMQQLKEQEGGARR